MDSSPDSVDLVTMLLTIEHLPDLKGGRLKGWRDFDPEQRVRPARGAELGVPCRGDGRPHPRDRGLGAHLHLQLEQVDRAIFRPEAARA